MSRKIFVTKGVSGLLAPADTDAETVVNKWKCGQSFSLTYAPARNPQFHQMVFAVAQMVCDNAPDGSYWSNKDAYHFIKAVELSHGFTEETIDCAGEVHLIPRSIAFENMDQAEFKKLFDPLVSEAARILGISEQDVLSNMGNGVA